MCILSFWMFKVSYSTQSYSFCTLEIDEWKYHDKPIGFKRQYKILSDKISNLVILIKWSYLIYYLNFLIKINRIEKSFKKNLFKENVHIN